jgi:PEP-CTERM motif
MFVAVQAQAVPIVGTSGGTFGNLSSCDSSGSDANCRIVSTSNGGSTQVQWGSTNSTGDGFANPSTLTSVDININTNTFANDVTIGRLDWYNNGTTYDADLLTFYVDWYFSINFTQPTPSSDPNASETFHFTISNPVNPTADTLSGLSLASLQGIELSLAGVLINDLKYCVGGTCFTSGTWTNQEYALSSLYIKADFSAVGQQVARVPEPSTLSLLGVALLGLGFMQRRRKVAA